jgi:hypothetical protein
VSSSYCWRPAARRGGRAELGQRLGGVAHAEGSLQREASCAVAGLEMMHRCY